jgi:hypothetical protein
MDASLCYLAKSLSSFARVFVLPEPLDNPRESRLNSCPAEPKCLNSCGAPPEIWLNPISCDTVPAPSCHTTSPLSLEIPIPTRKKGTRQTSQLFENRPDSFEAWGRPDAN